MAENLTVCSIHPELKEKLKKFRFRKETNNAALVLKIDKDSKQIMLENEYEDCVLEDLVAELPSSQPRYIAISYCYKRDDGRVSYPLCFIFLSPQGCKPEQQMMYAGSKKQLVDVGGFTKDFEVRNADEITEEWLLDKLSFFR